MNLYHQFRVFVSFCLEGGRFKGESLPKLGRNGFLHLFFTIKYIVKWNFLEAHYQIKQCLIKYLLSELKIC
jgi:hypothetical protein